MTRETPRMILERRSFGKCEACGLVRGAEAHHRQFRSRGGRDGMANLVLLCGFGNHAGAGCHGRAHSDAGWATRYGFAVPSWGDPGSTPVYLATWAAWALLRDDGDFTFVEPP